MKRVTDFARFRAEENPISMVTCYDAWSAALIADTDIDCVLVGDSLAMVVYGHDTTLPADMDTMAAHTAAVRRGAPGKFLIGDMPFLSYRRSLESAVDNAGKLMRAGAQAVKLEGAEGNTELVRHLVESGVPVMGHLGLTPQSVHRMGGYLVQGREQARADQLMADARAVAEAGACAIVLEGIPAKLASEITAGLTIPTIGIGAGVDCDGQVLVLYDMLGITPDRVPKFVRNFLEDAGSVPAAIRAYVEAVKDGSFPAPEHCF